MPPEAAVFRGHCAPGGKDGADGERQEEEATVHDELAETDEDAGGERQGIAEGFEDDGESGDDKRDGEEEGSQTHEDHDQGVDEGGDDLFTHFANSFVVSGQTLKHVRQGSAGFARSDHCDVERGEGIRELSEGIGQRTPLIDGVAKSGN